MRGQSDTIKQTKKDVLVFFFFLEKKKKLVYNIHQIAELDVALFTPILT
jgi:hypothetical protein